jgi:hypothetical protein
LRPQILRDHPIRTARSRGILGIKHSSAPEETTMMHATTAQALGQARRTELHHQARNAALARAAHRTGRNQRRQRKPGLLAALADWARRPRPARESS